MKNLVILCGGLSSRMGSDKARLKIGETTFIEHICLKAADYFDRIIISIDTEEHAEQIRRLPLFEGLCPDADAFLFVLDKYEKAGPIGGIISVFEQTDTEKFSIISVDVPGADMRILARLYELACSGVTMLQMEGKKPEPLIAVYSREVLPALKKSLEEGMHKLKLAIPEEMTTIITEGEATRGITGPEADLEKAFRNYNTQKELKELYD